MDGESNDQREVLDQLLTPEGRALVESLTPYDETTSLAAVAAARRDPQWADRPAAVAAAATQARLRTRAAARFPGPPRWWTPDGLEQATRPEVAERHAGRFISAGVDEVVDLGCGAGSDAIALATNCMEVLAVDRDPAVLWALSATARDLDLSIGTRLGDVTTLDAWWNRGVGQRSDPPGAGSLSRGAGCFVDPARRSDGRRRLAPEYWSPPLSWVVALADRVPATGAKVAPGIDHAAIPGDAQAEWTSVDGALVEAALWWGPTRMGPARRLATVIRGGTTSRDEVRELPTWAKGPPGVWVAADNRVATLDDWGGVPVPDIGPVGAWLVEPDPAVIRAGLVSVLADRLGGRLLDPRIAYIVTDHEPEDSPLGATFEVLDELPFARKALRAWLRAHGFGDVIIKKRGVDVVPEELRKALRLRGEGPTATLVLTRTDAGPMALQVRRRG